MPSFQLDGSWVDVATIALALLFVFYKHFRVWQAPKFFSKRTAYDLMTGTSVFPLLMLALSALSNAILRSLLDCNRMALSVAGIFALFTLLEDEFARERSPRRLSYPDGRETASAK